MKLQALFLFALFCVLTAISDDNTPFFGRIVR